MPGDTARCEDTNWAIGRGACVVDGDSAPSPDNAELLAACDTNDSSCASEQRLLRYIESPPSSQGRCNWRQDVISGRQSDAPVIDSDIEAARISDCMRLECEEGPA